MTVRRATWCVQCSKDQPITAFLSVVCSLTFVFWFFTFWYPMLPECVSLKAVSSGMKKISETIEERLLTMMDTVSSLRDGVDDFKSILTTAVKIIIGFYQVTLTFIKNFNVTWPDSIRSLITGLSFLSLDFFSLPGTDCLSASLPYLHKLYIVSIVPLVLVALLILPGLCALFQDKEIRGMLAEKVMFWLLFLLFTIYPFVSSVILQTFSCVDLGRDANYLMVDFRVACPVEAKGQEFLIAVVFSLVYPIGIPVFMLAVLLYFEVPLLAKRKMFMANLTAVLEKMLFANEDRELIREIQRKVEECPLRADPLLRLNHVELQTMCSFLRGHSGAEVSKESSQINLEIERHNMESLDLTKLITSALDDGTLTSAKLQWGRGKEGSAWFEQEERAIRHAGFLFESYKVKFWYFEMIEKSGKLVLTSVVLFVYEGTYLQVAFAAFVTFISLVVYLLCEPLVYPVLDQQQALGLVIQFLTLFYGLTLILKEQDQEAISYGAYYSFLEGLIFFLNSIIAFYLFIKFSLVNITDAVRRFLSKMLWSRFIAGQRQRKSISSFHYTYSNVTFAQEHGAVGEEGATNIPPPYLRNSAPDVEPDVRAGGAELAGKSEEGAGLMGKVDPAGPEGVEQAQEQSYGSWKQQKLEVSSSYIDLVGSRTRDIIFST
eukprot:753530-Hanusia_phi.AAC.6